MNDSKGSSAQVKGSFSAYLAFNSFLILLPMAALWHRDLLLPEVLPGMAFFSFAGLISAWFCLLRRIHIASALKAGLSKFGKHSYVFPIVFLLTFVAADAVKVGLKERDMLLLLSRSSVLILGLFFLVSYVRYVIAKRKAAGEGVTLIRRWNSGEIPVVIYCLICGMLLLHYAEAFPITALIVPFPLLFAASASALFFEAGRNLRSFKDRNGNNLTWAYLIMGMLFYAPMRISLIELQEAFSEILPHRILDVAQLSIRPLDLINFAPLLFVFGIVPGLLFKGLDQSPPRIAEGFVFGLLLTALLSLYLPVSYYAFPFIAAGSMVVALAIVNRLHMGISAGIPLSGQSGTLIMLIGSVIALVICVIADTRLPDVWILLNGYLSYWLLLVVALLLSFAFISLRSIYQAPHLKNFPAAVWSLAALALLLSASLWAGWHHRTIELQDSSLAGVSLKDSVSEPSYDHLKRYTWPSSKNTDDPSTFRTHLTFETDDRKVAIKRWSLLRFAKRCEGVTVRLPSSPFFGPTLKVAGITLDGSLDIKTMVKLSRQFSSPILSFESGQNLMDGGAVIRFKDGEYDGLLKDDGPIYVEGEASVSSGRQLRLSDCSEGLVENRVFRPDTIDRLEKIDTVLVVRPPAAAVYDEIGGSKAGRKLPAGLIVQPAFRIKTARFWYFSDGWVSEESLLPYDELIAQIRGKRDMDPSTIFKDPLHRYFNASGKDYLVENYLKAQKACEVEPRSGERLPYEPLFRMLITDPETTPLVMEKKPAMQVRISLGDGTLHTVSQGLTLQTDEELKKLNAALADDLEKWKSIFAAHRGESELWPDYPVLLMEYEQRLDCMVDYTQSGIDRSLVLSNKVQIHGIQYESKMATIEEKNGIKYAVSGAGVHLLQPYYSDFIRTMEVEFCKQYAERMATEEEVRQYYGEEDSVPRPGTTGYRTLCIAR
ncbi:MAG: hypothetical protein HS115_14550 [Spirochaetales bacterium]|nr:hypothetical protein [Spirochaetales bacterium]